MEAAHFPNEKAAEIAWKTVTAFLEKHGDSLDRIIFNVFKDRDWNVYEKIIPIDSFKKENAGRT